MVRTDGQTKRKERETLKPARFRKITVTVNYVDHHLNIQKQTLEKLELVFVKHYAPNCLTLTLLDSNILAHDGNNSTNIRDLNVILLKGNNSTRIQKIGCVACLKRQPFHMNTGPYNRSYP